MARSCRVSGAASDGSLWQINEVDEPWTVEGLMREIQEDLQLERDKIEDAASA